MRFVNDLPLETYWDFFVSDAWCMLVIAPI